MTFCTKCGAEAPEDIKFCPKCGSNLQGGQSPSNEGKPSLWGPTAAANLSVLSFPLGAFLHYQNWKTLKQESKAKTSLIWFICLIVFFPLSLIILIPWYFMSAKGQIKYIGEKYGSEYNKKSLLILIPIIIVANIILVVYASIMSAIMAGIMAIIAPMLMGSSPKAKASEVTPAASTWSKLQQAYIMENGRVGDCSQIGYTPPGNGIFTYKCGVQGGLAIWMAENSKNLDKCKAGNQWVVTMNKNEEIEAKLPGGEDCEALTPSFCKLVATSGKCTDN